jgi:hypothetical protein
MYATSSECLQAFFAAGDSSVSKEVAGIKIRFQSASTLNTQYISHVKQFYCVVWMY